MSDFLVEKVDGVIVVSPESAVNEENSYFLSRKIKEFLEQGMSCLAVNMALVAGLPMCSCAVLLNLARRARENGGDIIFFGLTESFEKIRGKFFQENFKIFESREEAIRAFTEINLINKIDDVVNAASKGELAVLWNDLFRNIPREEFRKIEEAADIVAGLRDEDGVRSIFRFLVTKAMKTGKKWNEIYDQLIQEGSADVILGEGREEEHVF